MNKECTIIYIDDEESNVKIFEIKMSKKFNVLTGFSGADGLKLLETHDTIKVVLPDLRMPGMSGIEFITIASEKYKNLKFFLLTGFEITQEIQQLLDTNSNTSYFAKPLNMQEIELAINAIIAE